MCERHNRRRVAEVTITFYMKYSCHAIKNNIDKVKIHYFINQYISPTLLYGYFCRQANGRTTAPYYSHSPMACYDVLLQREEMGPMVMLYTDGHRSGRLTLGVVVY